MSQIGGEAKGTASVREVASLDEIDITASMLPPNQTFTVYASDGTKPVTLRDVTSNEMGSVDEELAFAKSFDNGYDRVTLVPAMPDTGGS